MNILTDETSIGAASGQAIAHPIRLFAFQNLSALNAELVPLHDELEWDAYDVRRMRMDLLRAHLPARRAELDELFPAYYEGALSDAALDPFIAELDDAARAASDALRPYRRRCIANFLLRRAGTDRWQFEGLSKTDFRIRDTSDYRALRRRFRDRTEQMLTLPCFQTFLEKAGSLVGQADPAVRAFEANVHLVQIFARGTAPGDNSPEGIHQDGSDYIISALVLARHRITGGQSRIYGPDRSTVYFTHVLEPGQGLFQADAGSSLFHDVSPVSLDSFDHAGEGWRTILGMDIHIVERG